MADLEEGKRKESIINREEVRWGEVMLTHIHDSVVYQEAGRNPVLPLNSQDAESGDEVSAS